MAAAPLPNLVVGPHMPLLRLPGLLVTHPHTQQNGNTENRISQGEVEMERPARHDKRDTEKKEE